MVTRPVRPLGLQQFAPVSGADAVNRGEKRELKNSTVPVRSSTSILVHNKEVTTPSASSEGAMYWIVDFDAERFEASRVPRHNRKSPPEWTNDIIADESADPLGPASAQWPDGFVSRLPLTTNEDVLRRKAGFKPDALPKAKAKGKAKGKGKGSKGKGNKGKGRPTNEAKAKEDLRKTIESWDLPCGKSTDDKQIDIVYAPEKGKSSGPLLVFRVEKSQKCQVRIEKHGITLALMIIKHIFDTYKTGVLQNADLYAFRNGVEADATAGTFPAAAGSDVAEDAKEDRVGAVATHGAAAVAKEEKDEKMRRRRLPPPRGRLLPQVEVEDEEAEDEEEDEEEDAAAAEGEEEDAEEEEEENAAAAEGEEEESEEDDAEEEEEDEAESSSDD